MLRTWTLLVVAVLTATGCGTGEATAELSDQLRYVRSGGFAGAQDELVIQPNGRATLTMRGHEQRDFELSEEELDALTGALDDIGLGDIPSDSTSAKPAPDAFSYLVSYGGKEVRTDDPSMPPDLRPLIAQLNGLVDKHRPQ